MWNEMYETQDGELVSKQDIAKRRSMWWHIDKLPECKCISFYSQLNDPTSGPPHTVEHSREMLAQAVNSHKPGCRILVYSPTGMAVFTITEQYQENTGLKAILEFGTHFVR